MELVMVDLGFQHSVW